MTSAQNKLKAIENVGGKKYYNMILEDIQDKYKVKDPNRLLSNHYLSLKHFVRTCFFRGRSDQMSENYAKCAFYVLDNLTRSEDELLAKNKLLVKQGDRIVDDYRNEVAKIQRKVRKKGSTQFYKTNEKDASLLKSIFNDFLHDLDDFDYNVTKYSVHCIRQHRLSDVHRKLDDIDEVGSKLASFYLRDLVSLFKLEGKYVKSKEDYLLIQPVDTWVRQISRRLWPNVGDKDEEIKSRIVDECLKANVSPIKFNQGAWFTGAKALNLIMENITRII